MSTVPGRALHLPEPTGPDLSAAVAEACIRLAIRRIQAGERNGRLTPDPASRWAGSWQSIGESEITLTIETTEPLDAEHLHAVAQCIGGLGLSALFWRAAGKAAWDIPIEVRPL